MSVEIVHLLLIFLASTVGAVGLLKSGQMRVINPSPRSASIGNDGDLVFLIEGKQVIDASTAATKLIAPFLSKKMNDFDAMLYVLSPIFPQIIAAIDTDNSVKTEELAANERNLLAQISHADTRTRLTIKRTNHPAKTNFIEDDFRLAELDMLREFAKQTPQLIWKEDEKGNVIWSNQAYLALSDSRQPRKGTLLSWPRSPIFPPSNNGSTQRRPTLQRISTTNKSTKLEHWFDVSSVAQGVGTLHFATDADAVVRAEQDRRTFVQTVGKTFAQLSIGLAIFDKRRQLSMFNPALLDLTGLSAEFLSGRPTVDAILDKLREARVLPEPKNYRSWREEFMAFETEAKNGTYCEIWNLPEGQSYRVTGRPHPDGAFAILFEDISSEVTLTRRFRSDIETSQAVLDAISEPIAVFSGSGSLVMSNLAYSKLWALENASYLEQRDIRSESQIWQDRCSPTLMWSDLINATYTSNDRKPRSGRAVLLDGRHISCFATPIANAMTMVRFTQGIPNSAHAAKLAIVDTNQKSSRASN